MTNAARSTIKQYPVKASSREDKKSMRDVQKVVDGKGVKAKTVHLGDPKLSIKKDRPERKASYCARSAGIKGSKDPSSPDYQSRKAWG